MDTEAMTTTQTLTAESVADIRWMDPNGFVRGFQNSRLYGVTDGQGHWLTFVGDAPGAWDRKRTAVEIATTVDVAGVQWVTAI